MSNSSLNGGEVELDQHSEAGRQVSALLSAALSAALAAAQSAAQVVAQRARENTREADQQTRQAQQSRVAAARQLERQQRTAQAVRHRQWGLKPTAQWLHDRPLSAAAAWASAEVYRGSDPVAARHADQWGTVFKREGIDVDDIQANVRANAPATLTGLVASAEQDYGAAAGSVASTGPSTGPVELAGEFAAAEVAAGAVMAGAVDCAAEEAAAEVAEHAQAGSSVGRTSPWSAYADGFPAAALGGLGVSTPPDQVLAKAREAPDLASTTPQGAARAVELVNSLGFER